MEPLSSTDLDIEQVVALRPDLVILSSFIVDELGSALDGAGFDTIVVPDGDWRDQVTTLDAGVVLQPGADTAGASSGRVYLSAEQWGLLDAPILVLSQSDPVDGEPESLAAIGQDPRWQLLPAVAAGQVVQIDRLAYPGVQGRTRLAQELLG